MKKILRIFDKLEDKVRTILSHTPILYGIVGGTFVVLFWRGVWHTADILETWGGWWGIVFSGPGTLILAMLALMASGLMVSTFIGNNIIISGLKREKKAIDKTEVEIKEEEDSIKNIKHDILQLKQAILDFKDNKQN